ncbi:helix-turn-helix domain-containing protein [Leptospira sp. 96542]|nr:helix-turn-helix domain-containing protein [Leptospira sp. 96542]
MSVANRVTTSALHWALELRRVTPAEKLVLLGIARFYSNDANEGWVKVGTLALNACCEERSVSRILARLEADGYLTRKVQEGGSRSMSNRVRPNAYVLHLDRPEPREVVHTDDPRVTPQAPRDDREVTPRDDREVTPRDDREVTPIMKRVGDREENTPLPPKGGKEVDSSFERILAAYPRSTNAGVARARVIWQTLRPNADLVRVMLAAIERQARSDEWQRNRGQFVPKLSRWLAEQRWLDTHDAGALRVGQALQGQGSAPPPEPPRTPEQLAENARRAAEARAQLGLPPKARAVA